MKYLSIVGLCLDLVGAICLFIREWSDRISDLQHGITNDEKLIVDLIKKEKRRKRRLMIAGLTLLIVGFGLQLSQYPYTLNAVCFV